MLARVQSYLLQGIDALACEVEVDFDDAGSQERPIIVGLPDAGVKESLERVRSAMGNAGYAFPNGRLVVNLAPADVRKEGPMYDLPMAVGMLVVQGIIRTAPKFGAVPATSIIAEPEEGLDYRSMVFAGELALDGRVRPIKGAIAMASLAKARGAKGIIVPADNAAEAAVVRGIDVFGVRTLSEVVGLLTGHMDSNPVPPVDVETLLRNTAAPIDFAEVRGQEGVKRAIVISAAGGHNLLRL
jgi:magnesium chelatase family protein